MWDCESCGTQAIAGDLERCPACGKDRAHPVSESAPGESGLAAGGLVTGVAPLVGEQAPEPWDTSKSVTQNLADDPALKGEHGPELTDLPSGATVTTPPPAPDNEGD